MSDQLQMFEEHNYQKLTQSLSEALAKTLVSLENVKGWEEIEAPLLPKQFDSSKSNADHVFLIWENVKENILLKQWRKTFWAITSRAFTFIWGYRLEWQLLNTKWFLPQNKRDIYLVGYLGDGSGGQVFPIGKITKGINERTRAEPHTV